MRQATAAGRLQRERVPYALSLSSHRLSIAVSTGKNVAEHKRNRPLQNNFDFSRKEELSDEEGSGEKSWLQLPSLLNTVEPTFVMSTPVFVGLGL